MDADTILATARFGNVPEYWHVWPLHRDRVRTSAIKWGLESLVGLALFVPAVIITVPVNFEHGGGEVVLTSLLLMLLGAVALGGLGIAMYDLRRYVRAGEYLLVVTPDDYVKAEPRKVTHVPLEHVSYVTLRGVKSSFDQAINQDDVFQPQHQVPFMRFTPGRSTKRSSQAPSLAFIDDRANKQVVVATDDAFDDLSALEYVLQTYADAKQRKRTHSG
jgi:hypothetical protein